ncbi:MAG: hypothetical protein WCH84_11245 [Verrucomicrobiota bacterium]
MSNTSPRAKTRKLFSIVGLVLGFLHALSAIIRCYTQAPGLTDESQVFVSIMAIVIWSGIGGGLGFGLGYIVSLLQPKG